MKQGKTWFVSDWGKVSNSGLDVHNTITMKEACRRIDDRTLKYTTLILMPGK